MTSQIQRVKVTLNKYISTWEGKVLKYLHEAHPDKKNGTGAAMDSLSMLWLPYAMRFFGASEAEYKEVATRSVRFLLSHACSIVSEFGLPGVTVQGLVTDSAGARISESAYSPLYKGTSNDAVAVENYANNIVGGNDVVNEYEDKQDDEDDIDFEEMSFPSLDAGFRT